MNMNTIPTKAERSRKVMLIHIKLSVFALLLSILYKSEIIWFNAVLLLLQSFFLMLLEKHGAFLDFLCIISVPVWSFCFAWIFVRVRDWLNHFPVLGKRVF